MGNENSTEAESEAASEQPAAPVQPPQSAQPERKKKKSSRSKHPTVTVSGPQDVNPVWQEEGAQNAERASESTGEECTALQIYGANAVEAQDGAGGLAGFAPNGMLAGVFSVRKPKNIGSGLSSGVKSSLKGVGIGLTSAVVLPAVGAHNEGVSGFFKGLGVGLVLAVTMPIAGLTVGVTQIVRGAINTPEAIQQQNNAMKWDKETREWRKNWYSLPEDQENIDKKLAEEKQKRADRPASAGPNPDRVVKETDLYQVLGVETSATQSEIRKAYYELARSCHPDKHPDDPEANKKFQRLGEAYQLLGDEKRRQQYDKEGAKAAEGISIIDNSLFFTTLFGSEALEPYVGKLQLALLCQLGDDAEEELLKLEQQKREVDLAVQLSERIKPYVDGTPEQQEAWRTAMKSEADKLCEKSFGDAIVEAVGWTYENYATQFLAKQDSFIGWGKRVAKMQAQRRKVGNYWRTVAGVARLKNASSIEGTEAEEHALNLLVDSMLNMCRIDIESTVKKATKKVVKDMSVAEEQRRARAIALSALGQIMQQAAEDYEEAHKEQQTPEKTRKQVENAMHRAQQEGEE